MIDFDYSDLVGRPDPTYDYELIRRMLVERDIPMRLENVGHTEEQWRILTVGDYDDDAAVRVAQVVDLLDDIPGIKIAEAGKLGSGKFYGVRFMKTFTQEDVARGDRFRLEHLSVYEDTLGKINLLRFERHINQQLQDGWHLFDTHQSRDDRATRLTVVLTRYPGQA